MTSKSAPSSTWAEQVLAETHRSDWGRLLSLLVSRTRRLDLAEDALAEAFARASQRWPATGIPDNPAGWLYTTASRVIVGRLRAEAVHQRKAPLLAVDDVSDQPPLLGEPAGLADERLAIILLCCHPALAPEVRPALALRLVIGTPTEEIARLFLVPRATMAARLTRAKKKIVVAGIPLSAPVGDELLARLDDVCRTIYLAFTAGYAPGRGPDLLRADLAGEAVELAAVLDRLVPGADQVRALHGLLLIQHSRRDARVDDGRLVSLAEQDRSKWHRDELGAGTRLVADLPAGRGWAEVLRLQGLIATEHANAATARETDWPAIADLYRRLERLTASPVVRMNRAVAVAEADGPEAGLALLQTLDAVMADSHRLHSVRAELARRAGDSDLARSSYLAAMERCANEVEHDHLRRELDTLDRPSSE